MDFVYTREAYGLKRKIRAPFFELGVKYYIYGDRVLEMALLADKLAKKYDVDLPMTTPFCDIRWVAQNTDRVIVFAPYMDNLRPPCRGQGSILPESIKAAGADGVVLNHCECPISIAQLKRAIEIARELDLLSMVCADSVAEARAVAHFHPDIIVPEPTEYIGSGRTTGLNYVLESVKAIREIDPDIIVEVGAGVSTPEDVYRNIYAGADGTGACSGIHNAPDPFKMFEDMVCKVRKAGEDRLKNQP
jgi:triosephosphate isomerase